MQPIETLALDERFDVVMLTSFLIHAWGSEEGLAVASHLAGEGTWVKAKSMT